MFLNIAGIRLLNNTTCADEFSEILVLAKRNGLVKMSLDTPDFTDVAIPLEGDAYFAVKTSDSNGEGGEGGTVWDFNAVAVDFNPVSRHVYWTDQSKGIFRTELDGSDVINVVADDVDQPDGVAVDWIAGNLFWSDTGTDRIEVSKLDGTSRKVLVSRGLDEPRDIALDPINGWMYWSDWGDVAKIERAWMDGTHRQVVVSKGTIQHTIFRWK